MLELIIQLIAGAAGGNIAGALLKNQSLGTLGNSLAGGLAARFWACSQAGRQPGLPALRQAGSTSGRSFHLSPAAAWVAAC